MHFNKSVKKKKILCGNSSSRLFVHGGCDEVGHHAETELWVTPWRPRVPICGLQLVPACP